jgi:hypothetical protein
VNYLIMNNNNLVRNTIDSALGTSSIFETDLDFNLDLDPEIVAKIKIVVLALIGIGIVVGLVYYFNKIIRVKLMEPSNALIMENNLSNNPIVIPNCEITKPLDNFNFTLEFTIHIENYYQNYGYWRHIFHKGDMIRDGKTFNYGLEDWDSLIVDIPDQCPAAWLHPAKNSIRFVVMTERGIEYVDIEDIPTQTDVAIKLIVVNNSIFLYINKILKRVYTVTGKLVYNQGPMYFHHNKTYSGELKLFKYYPKAHDV